MPNTHSSIPTQSSRSSNLLIRTDVPSQPEGYATISGPSGEVAEARTATCAHCQFIIIIKPGSGTKRGWCRQCNEIVCGKQGCLERCTPFERALEVMENRERFRTRLAKVF